jgi:hypothetical protein
LNNEQNDLKPLEMLHVEASIDIVSPQPLVMRLYMDYNNWHKLFPLTIRAARCVKEEDGVFIVEVDHKKEGFVTNILTVLSNEEIQLEEFKPKYNATFINRFHAITNGTRYTILANISLKGIYKIASPFIKNAVKNRIMELVLKPMKKFSEIAE